MQHSYGNGRLVVAILAILSFLSAGTETTHAAVTSCPYVCSWDGGKRPDDVIRSVRDGLIALRPSLENPKARSWVDRTNIALDWTLNEQRWTPAGVLRPTSAGAGGVVGIRAAAARLTWGHPDLAAASEAELRALVASMSRLVESRLDEVTAAGGDPSVVARARYDLTKGDDHFGLRPVQASYSYLQAWNRLVSLPPFDADSPPPDTLPDESEVPGGDDEEDPDAPPSSGGSNTGAGSGTKSGSGGGGQPGGGGGQSGGDGTRDDARVLATDIKITALPSTGRTDRVAQLRYRVRADRPTREELWILDGKTVVRRVNTAFATRSGREAAVWLRLPVVAGRLRFCARAVDQAGRSTTTSCVPFEVRFVARAMAARGVAGRVVPLRFRLEWKQPAAAVIEIMSGTRRLQRLKATGSNGGGLSTFRWRSRAALAGKTLSFCLVAQTAAGERSVRTCARLHLTRR